MVAVGLGADRVFTLGAVKRRSVMENWNEARMEVRNGAKERNGAH